MPARINSKLKQSERSLAGSSEIKHSPEHILTICWTGTCIKKEKEKPPQRQSVHPEFIPDVSRFGHLSGQVLSETVNSFINMKTIH